MTVVENEAFLKEFQIWRKAVGELLHRVRLQQEDSIEAFLKKTAQDRPFLNNPKIWAAIEAGRIRAPNRYASIGEVVTEADYVNSIRAFVHVYYFPEERSKEKTALRNMIKNCPRRFTRATKAEVVAPG